jgi:hypothetical protein
MDILVSKIRVNEEAQGRFWNFLQNLSRRLPPCKNENKFLYGKQSEYRFRDLCEEVGSPVEILGDDSYFDDFVFRDSPAIRFSYKMTKIKGSIRVINFHRKKIVLDESFLEGKNLCIANLCKQALYIFPLKLLPLPLYRERMDGIELSSRYLKYIEKHHPENVVFWRGLLEGDGDGGESELKVNEMVYRILCGEKRKRDHNNKNEEEPRSMRVRREVAPSSPLPSSAELASPPPG